MVQTSKPTALVTGASSGIGATYADRLARRGHDLVLVARDKAKLDALAADLRKTAGVKVDVLQADLTRREDLARVEGRLRDDATIGLLVNNAGVAAPGGIAQADLDELEDLVRLNVTSVVRLTGAVVPRLVEQGRGSIVNISSVLGFAPEISTGIYAASKAFVTTQSLHTELDAQGIYVQAVLPAATRTDIWKKFGRNVDEMQGVMDVGEMVDAALVGFDRRETITIPSLPDAGQWDAYNGARQAMLPNVSQEHAAARYRA